MLIFPRREKKLNKNHLYSFLLTPIDRIFYNIHIKILVSKRSNSNNDTICAGKITILVNIGHAPKAWQCLQLKYIYIFVFRSNKTNKYNIAMNDRTVEYCFHTPDKRLLHIDT